jgi:hypothetical protein
MFYQEFCIHNYQTHEEDITIFMDVKMLSNMGAYLTSVCRSTPFDIS